MNKQKTKKMMKNNRNKTKKTSFVKSQIRFIKSNVNSYEKLYTKENGIQVINPEYLIKKNIKINPLPKHFNLFKNGFQLLDLNKSASLKNIIQRFKTIDGTSEFKDEREDMRKQLKKYIMEHIGDFKKMGYTKGIDYDDIVIVDSVFRNTDKKLQSQFKSVGLAHTDFDPFMTDYAFIYPFLDKWGKKLENTLGEDVYDKSYWKIGKKIAKVCNIWVSLTDPYIQNDPLILCDLDSFNEKQIIPYIASRRATNNKREDTFIAQSIKFSNNNKWYTKKKMKMGEAYIFESFKTPHGAVHIDNDFSRKSMEFRVLFIKHKNIPKQAQKYYLKGGLVVVDTSRT